MATTVMVAIAAYVSIPKSGPTEPALIGVTSLVAVLFVVLLILRWRLCRRPQNWLLRTTDHGAYINLRTFMNHHLDPETHQVLYIPTEEIAALCKTEEKRHIPDHHGRSKDQFSYLDFYFVENVDLEPVRRALREERRREAKAGIFRRPKHHDYPVRVLDPPGIRLVWEWIKPDENCAINMLSDLYPVAPNQTSTFHNWDKLNETEKDMFLAELWETGHVEDVIRLVRMRRGISERAAREYLRDQYESD